ncbi:MAG: M48 family metalloprotease [Saprospiraceae bacterium]|nr:M48 family metalloprotease [Saprospiraceae bacterium]
MEYLFTFLELEGFVWTLLHSLWQFTLIGMLVIAINRRMKKVSALSRYWVLALALLCMPLVSIVTYHLVKSQEIPEHVVAAPLSGDSKVALDQETKVAGINSWGVKQIVEQWISSHAFYVFLFWACGILVLGIRMLMGQLQLLQLRTWGQAEVGNRWQLSLRELSDKIGVKKEVHLAASHLVREPITFGFIKPIILFPVGLVNALPQAEVEAILWQELAHIKRHDYLFNLVQSLLETLFFYHPVLWLLSKEIRDVREECCDDLVLQHGMKPMVYAEALLHLARLINAQNNQFVMSTNSLNSAISTRIKRLFSPASTPARYKPLTALLAVIMILCLTAYAGVSLQAQSQVSIELEQLNVLYLDVEHPITVAAEGVPAAELKVTSEDLEVIPKSSGKYVLKGKKLGEATLEISGPGGKIREAQYEVRRFPDVLPSLAGEMGGTIWKSTLDKLDRIELSTPTDFPNQCRLTSFNVTYVRKGQDPEEVVNHTGVFSTRTRELFNKAAQGDIYYFDKMKCQCGTEAEERRTAAMVFTIAVKEKKIKE